MAENEVGIDIVARLDQFKRDMAAIPDIGGKEAKALVAQLNREIKAATAASKAAAKAAQEAKKETLSFGDAAGKAGSSIGKLGGALDLVIPGASAITQAFGDFADVGELAGEAAEKLSLTTKQLALGLGAVVVVLGAAYLAYDAYTKSVEAAEVALEAEKKATEENLDIQRKVVDATLKLANIKGEISDKEFARLSAAQTADEVFAAKKLGLIERINEENAALQRNQQVLADTADRQEEAATGFDAIARAQAGAAAVDASTNAARKAATEGVAEHTATIEKLSQELGQLVTEEGAYAAVLLETEQGTNGTADATAAFNAEVEALRASLAGAAADRQLEANVVQISAESEMAAIFATMDTEAQLDKERAKYADAQAARLEELAAEQARYDSLQLSAASDLAGALSSIAASAAETMTEEDREARAALFAAQQVGAYAQAGVNAALGISEAAASAPPPYNALPILAATAQGAASLTAVMAVPAPTFNDTPGVQQMGTRGNVSLGAGDFFAAARDPAELQRQVMGDPFAGPSTGGGSYTVIGPRAFGRFIRDDVRQRTPLARAINTGTGRAGRRGRR